MTITKTSRRSFAGGEITPEMYGRLDNVKNQTGLALCRNALVLPHGPASKRPGFGFVNVAHDFGHAVRALPFAFSASQSMVLEFGHQYLRFHTGGATLLEAAQAITSIASSVVTQPAHGYVAGDVVYIGNRFLLVAAVPDANTYSVVDTISGASVTPSGATAARVYKITTPYAAADLFALKFTQDADVLTISHPSYATRELRRLAATNWTLTAPALGTATAPPTGLVVTPVAGSGTSYAKNHYYKVTTVVDGVEESLPTAAVLGTVDLTLPGAYNGMNWVAPVGVTSPTFRVYKATGGPDRIFGYIGETSGLNFIDDNIIPDYSSTPPFDVLRLDTAGNYPAAVTYHDQRRVFGGPTSNPQAIFMTRVGTESDLSVSYPAQAKDAISIRIKAQQQNAIRHLVPLSDLLALTAGGVWRVYSSDDGALLPANVAARPQSFDGCSDVRPLLTGSAVLFVENTGKRVRDIAYSNEARGYITDDRSILAPHLFNRYTLADAAFQRNPDKIAWFVRDDGTLLSMTYMPEQQVFAWSQHVTDGAFESVCVVPEDNQDVLYAVVRRTQGTYTYRAIERMAAREFDTQADAFFVDSGFTYDGPAVETLSGLWHLEGRSVVVLADGGVLGRFTVTAGAITLPVAARKVQVGLPFTTDIQTLPLAVEAAVAAGQGAVKAINYAYLLVNRTGPLQVGPNEDSLREVQLRTNEPYDTPPRLKDEEVDILIDPDWTTAGQMWIRSSDPTPCTISAITLQVNLAG